MKGRAEPAPPTPLHPLSVGLGTGFSRTCSCPSVTHDIQQTDEKANEGGYGEWICPSGPTCTHTHRFVLFSRLSATIGETRRRALNSLSLLPSSLGSTPYHRLERWPPDVEARLLISSKIVHTPVAERMSGDESNRVTHASGIQPRGYTVTPSTGNDGCKKTR